MLTYKYDDLINPTLLAIKDLGGSASNNEIQDKIIEILRLTEDEFDDMHNDSTTKLAYRLAWARTYLKKSGYIDNSSRGIWSVTEKEKKFLLLILKKLKDMLKAT